VQFGISLDKTLEEKWGQNNILDDATYNMPFERGYISFAGGGQNSRATQVFSFFSFIPLIFHPQHLSSLPYRFSSPIQQEGQNIWEKSHMKHHLVVSSQEWKWLIDFLMGNTFLFSHLSLFCFYTDFPFIYEFCSLFLYYSLLSF
jgi:hypothetical protein